MDRYILKATTFDLGCLHDDCPRVANTLRGNVVGPLRLAHSLLQMRDADLEAVLLLVGDAIATTEGCAHVLETGEPVEFVATDDPIDIKAASDLLATATEVPNEGLGEQLTFLALGLSSQVGKLATAK